MKKLESIIRLEEMSIILPKIEAGYEKYQKLMGMFNQTNVEHDLEFQKMFKGFYRMRRSSKDFGPKYFRLMEISKIQEISFKEILHELYGVRGWIESSFSSKLLATLNPEKPIWDKYILENLGLAKESTIRCLDKKVEIYEKIEEWYDDTLSKRYTQKVIAEFDNYFKGNNISDVKKIDFLLWQSRS